MPGNSFIESHASFERRWFRFSQLMWVLLLSLLVAGATGLSGGGGPLAIRETSGPGLLVRWERIARARSAAKLEFTLDAPPASGALSQAQLVLSGAVVTASVLRDITPAPKSVVPGTDRLTFLYDVGPGTRARIRMTQALQSPGLLRSTADAGHGPVELEQIVLP